jgi:hypothetical protein
MTSTPTPTTPAPPPHTCDWDLGDWSPAEAMAQASHDLVVIPRPVGFDTQDQLAAATIGSARAKATRDNAHPQARACYHELGIEDDRLVADAATLVQRFQHRFTDAPVNLRIEVCNQTTCPKFHYDHRRVRLVTTYAGPTTQYVFGDPEQTPRDAGLWELLLLKGSAHPTFSKRVYHRSPPMPAGQRRLCLVIDF